MKARKQKTKFESDVLGRCDPGSLTFAPWNPLSRIDATDKDFQTLVRSLRDHGQFMPVLITEHGLVIEGNRRVAACGMLGLPVEYVCRANRDAFLVYREVNSVRKAIKGTQIVEIAGKEERALTKQQQHRIRCLTIGFGGQPALIDYLRYQPQSGRIFLGSLTGADKVIRFCRTLGKNTPNNVVMAGVWAAEHGMTRYLAYVTRPLASGFPGFFDFCWNCVTENRPFPIPRHTGLARGRQQDEIREMFDAYVTKKL